MTGLKEKFKKKRVNFADRVIRVVKSIPKGEVMSYAEVARAAGSPSAARAVGNIMSRNKDKNIPCHRVIKSDGSLGGYSGFQGLKKELLQKEGYIK